jgi:hypothetical protein
MLPPKLLWQLTRLSSMVVDQRRKGRCETDCHCARPLVKSV